MLTRALITIALAVAFTTLAAADEISLYSADGSPIAYIDVGDEPIVYLWSGDPVAYLSRDTSGIFHVYGFNGSHLGWFESGVVWDHDGNATCALREALFGIAKLEPLKPLKRLTPLKHLQRLAPLKPLLSGRFGSMPCSVHLASGKS